MGASPLDRFYVRAEDLDADWRAHTGGEHVDPSLDRHGPGVGDTGDPQCLVHFLDEPLIRDVLRPEALEWPFQEPWQLRIPAADLAPLVFRLEHDGGLHHRKWRWVGGAFHSAGLAEDALDLREALDDLILLLQQRLGFGH